MGTQSTRLPDDLERYLKIIVAQGHARNESDAIRNIILERYLMDKEAGTIRPFSMIVRDRRTKAPDLSELNVQGIEKAATSEDAPHLGDPTGPLKTPVTATRDRSAEDVKPARSEKPRTFRRMSKPTYPGTFEQYEQDPQKDKFEPPEEGQ